MDEIKLLSDVEVKLIDSAASDIAVTRSAQVSVKGENKPETDTPRLINYLVESRHGCYDEETDILTESGWMSFPEFASKRNTPRVWTLNLETREQELQSPLRVVNEPYSGDMVRVLNQGVDLLVTPNHKIVAQPRVSGGWGSLGLHEASDLFDRSYRFTTAEGERSGTSSLSSDEEELLGFFIADGNYHNGSLTFHLRKERKISWLRDRASVTQNGDHYRLDGVSEEFKALAAQTYQDKERVIPPSVLSEWGTDSLSRLIDGFLEGDGYRRSDGKFTASTVSRQLVDDLMEAGAGAGRSVRLLRIETNRDSAYGNRPLYVLSFPERNSKPRTGWTTEDRSREISRVPFEGRVYCATVPNGTLFVRRNGKSLWCGNSPFEHTFFTFFIKAPLFVAREHMRHRTGWSYNEWSGRYSVMEPEFYAPNEDRPLLNVGTSARPEFEHGTQEQKDEIQDTLIDSYWKSWTAYKKLLDAGIANEVSRMALPVGLMTQYYATCNARSLMHFLSLRTDDEDAAVRSRPQLEIEMVARKMEAIFADAMPFTYASFLKAGRIAP